MNRFSPSPAQPQRTCEVLGICQGRSPRCPGCPATHARQAQMASAWLAPGVIDTGHESAACRAGCIWRTLALVACGYSVLATLLVIGLAGGVL